MIKVTLQNDLLVPVISCDVCLQKIADPLNGAAVNDSMLKMDEGESYEVLHVQKGACHDTAEARLGSHCGWEELSTHLYQLCYNLELTPKWFQQRARQFEEYEM